MKSFLPIGLVLITAALLWFTMGERNSEDSEQVLERTSEPSPQIETHRDLVQESQELSDPDLKASTSMAEDQLEKQKSAIQQDNTMESQSLDQTEKFLKQPQKGFVQIESVNGYAVGFGDIIFGKAPKNFPKGAAVFEPGKPKLWPSHQIPFAVSKEISDKSNIQSALDYFSQHSPIRFVEAVAEDENAIVFVPFQGRCASMLGMVGGHQPIFIDPKYCGPEQIVHEIMHALGFVHEQSRTDRDQYIEINWDNIKEGFEMQFHKTPENLVHNYRGSVFNFDFESVMLYRPFDFAKNPNKPVLESKTDKKIPIDKQWLSDLDKERLYYLYGY